MFHADCGGHTSTSVNAWGGTARPYLKAVPDEGHPESAHAQWTYSAGVAGLRSALNARLTDSRRCAPGPRFAWSTAILPAAPPRLRFTARAKQLVRGEDFRSILAGAVRSARRAQHAVHREARRPGVRFRRPRLRPRGRPLPGRRARADPRRGEAGRGPAALLSGHNASSRQLIAGRVDFPDVQLGTIHRYTDPGAPGRVGSLPARGGPTIE